VLTYPELHTLADTQPGGWVRLSERWADAASREMIARRYLGAAERDEDRARAPRGRRHWLMGRIAAKDAVRRWLWDRGAGPLFPAEVTIVSDGRGRPTVNVAGSSPVGVSIAHSGDLAVAIAGENAVGIDVEAVASRDPAMEALALTDAERVLLDRFAARDVAFTRFWAAKEAVSKAEGTGLEGRPTAFTVVAADHEQLRVHCAGSAREYAVDTTLIDGSPSYVVAWTRGESSANQNVPTYGGTISCETTLKSSSSRTSAGTSAR
jgi:phosphopantetheinyl transferase